MIINDENKNIVRKYLIRDPDKYNYPQYNNNENIDILNNNKWDILLEFYFNGLSSWMARDKYGVYNDQLIRRFHKYFFDNNWYNIKIKEFRSINCSNENKRRIELGVHNLTFNGDPIHDRNVSVNAAKRSGYTGDKVHDDKIYNSGLSKMKIIHEMCWKRGANTGNSSSRTEELLYSELLRFTTKIKRGWECKVESETPGIYFRPDFYLEELDLFIESDGMYKFILNGNYLIDKKGKLVFNSDYYIDRHNYIVDKTGSKMIHFTSIDSDKFEENLDLLSLYLEFKISSEFIQDISSSHIDKTSLSKPTDNHPNYPSGFDFYLNSISRNMIYDIV